MQKQDSKNYKSAYLATWQVSPTCVMARYSCSDVMSHSCSNDAEDMQRYYL